MIRIVIGVFVGFFSVQVNAADIARINARTLTENDLQQAIGSLPKAQASQLIKDKASRRQLINSMIDQELLVQKAESEKMDQSPEFKEALANFRRQYLSSSLLEKNLKSKMGPSQAKAYYERNKVRFSSDQVRALHILVPSEKEALDLKKQAEVKDADFQNLAEKHSMDPSAKSNRGDLGYFTRDRMVPEFADAAFAAKPGQIVGPVKTSFGWHVIKVTEFKPGKIPGYDEVEMQVQNKLRQSLIEGYVNDLRKTAKIQITDPSFK